MDSPTKIGYTHTDLELRSGSGLFPAQLSFWGPFLDTSGRYPPAAWHALCTPSIGFLVPSLRPPITHRDCDSATPGR